MRTRTLTLLRSVLVVVLVLGLATFPAGAEEPEPLPENPHERLAELRRRQAEAAFAIDLLNVTAVEVQERLAEVEAWVAAQQAVVDAAQEELVQATLAADKALAAEEAKADELERLEAMMAEVAVQAFVAPRPMATLEMLVAEDPDTAAKADVMLRARNDRDRKIADELARAEEELRALRHVADEEAARAESVAEKASDELDELNRARAEQVALAERISSDLADASERAAELDGAADEALEEVRKQTEALLARASTHSGVPLVQVGGFRVHAEIAAALGALLEHAERDGIVLRGWGARSTAQQIDLRRRHCGGPGVSDEEAVYGIPAAACSPPTAKPGTSMHELGLAIDFTHDGESISTRSSPAFQWLAEHAAGYGLKNLPSEPWHWSVNGR